MITAGIIGLGLIGGSLAKAYKDFESTVYGLDIDNSVYDFAKLSGAVDDVFDKDSAALCDIVLIAVTPRAAVEFLEEFSPYFSKNSIVIDCCGVKRRVCEKGFELAARYGYTFVGGHPMAGTHNSGFKYSHAGLFDNAPMVLVPPVFDDIELLTRVQKLLNPAKFGRFAVTTAPQHDNIIAFTSQLAHVVSNAYVKSPAAKKHNGFSAGSYKDLTRVAKLNPDMWAELFIENKTALISELDTLIASLTEYRNTIAEENSGLLTNLLSEGSRLKLEIDGR